MDAAAHTELITMAEEGSSAEEVEAPPPSFGRGLSFRRAGLATIGFAGLALIALAVTHASKGPDSTATSNITMLLESTAEKSLGRQLTGQEHKMLLEEFKKAQPRNLADTISAGSTSETCQKEFGGGLLRAGARLGAAALKVMLSCADEGSDACHEAKGEVDELKEKMKAECTEDPNTDVCQQTGDDMEPIDLCIPKSCQNDADVAALSKGDTTISCAAAASNIWSQISQNLHLPFR